MHYIDRGMHSHANQANDHKRATKLSECKCWNMSSNTEASQQNGKTGFIAGSCLYLPLYTVREVMYIKGYISTTQNSLCNKSSFSVFWSNLKKTILPYNFWKVNQRDRHAKIIHSVMYCEIYGRPGGIQYNQCLTGSSDRKRRICLTASANLCLCSSDLGWTI